MLMSLASLLVAAALGRHTTVDGRLRLGTLVYHFAHDLMDTIAPRPRWCFACLYPFAVFLQRRPTPEGLFLLAILGASFHLRHDGAEQRFRWACSAG